MDAWPALKKREEQGAGKGRGALPSSPSVHRYTHIQTHGCFTQKLEGTGGVLSRFGLFFGLLVATSGDLPSSSFTLSAVILSLPLRVCLSTSSSLRHVCSASLPWGHWGQSAAPQTRRKYRVRRFHAFFRQGQSLSVTGAVPRSRSALCIYISDMSRGFSHSRVEVCSCVSCHWCWVWVNEVEV